MSRPESQADVTAGFAGLPGLQALFAEDGRPRRRFCEGAPSPPRPSVPRRIIGYLISPGLNSWLRGFATGNKTRQEHFLEKGFLRQAEKTVPTLKLWEPGAERKDPRRARRGSTWAGKQPRD